MPLQNSGQISLNDLHVEAGGTSGTEASMNDSDIRGLLNASANSQMTFSGFYGASSVVLNTTITVGTWNFKAQYAYGLTFGGDPGQVGSASSYAFSSKNNGAALLEGLSGFYNGSSWTLSVSIGNKGTDNSNSGFSTLTVNGVTYNRSAATFTPGNALFWSWPASSNPVGTSTNGSTFTAVFA